MKRWCRWEKGLVIWRTSLLAALTSSTEVWTVMRMKIDTWTTSPDTVIEAYFLSIESVLIAVTVCISPDTDIEPYVLSIVSGRNCVLSIWLRTENIYITSKAGGFVGSSLSCKTGSSILNVWCSEIHLGRDEELAPIMSIIQPGVGWIMLLYVYSNEK